MNAYKNGVIYPQPKSTECLTDSHVTLTKKRGNLFYWWWQKLTNLEFLTCGRLMNYVEGVSVSVGRKAADVRVPPLTSMRPIYDSYSNTDWRWLMFGDHHGTAELRSPMPGFLQTDTYNYPYPTHRFLANFGNFIGKGHLLFILYFSSRILKWVYSTLHTLFLCYK